MKMRAFFYTLALALSLSVEGRAGGAPKAGDAAKSRAALYQVETRTVLTKRNWTITLDKPGRLVAEHYTVAAGTGSVELSSGGDDPLGVAQLSVRFQPQDVTSTNSEVHLATYVYGKKVVAGKYVVVGPTPLTDDGILKHIQRVLDEAERRLIASHPEYGAS